MVGGRFCYRSYFMHSIVLLLWVCLYYVEASSGKHVIHKNVGDTVELSSGLPTEGVTAATWRYGGITAADKDVGVFEKSPFKDRSELNLIDFTLTVRKLTLQDSGDFIFVSEVNDKQRPSVSITLQVHEPIAKPDIKISSTRISSNESCKVLLECSTTGDVSYKWTVGKQTLTGPRQQYIIRQDGETNFTCTVSNYVSEKSAFQTVKCSKDSHRKETECSSTSSLLMFIVGLFTGVLITLLFLFLLYCIKSKGLCHKRLTQSETIIQEENQQHVYSALSHGDRCVYETVRGSEDAGPGGSQIQCIKSD
ncbi:uncharacterized protein LOC102289799 [Haplochromis burtoni]|nr:uncharacterized protein LOC102289799 [Haplochromis burtoni]